jgi:oligopeptide transport system substrate-binding protein
MKKSKQSILVLIMAMVFCSTMFSGFTSMKSSSAKAATTQTTLTWNAGVDIPCLDPQLDNSIASANVFQAINEGLVRNHAGKVQPGLAKSWKISPDGKTYTFTLRDTKWSDGKAVTAKDFEYGILRLLNPKTASPYGWAGYVIKNGEEYNTGKLTDTSKVGVKAINAKTLQITLKNPAGYFLGYTSLDCFCPARKDLVEKYGSKFATSPETNVYSGPFLLKEWQHSDHATLVKNPNYWNKNAIKLQTVKVLMITDTQTALNMYLSGELDFVSIPAIQAESYIKSGQAKVYMTGADDWFKINLKVAGKPWFNNLDFRKALNFAVNREEYVKAATKGLYFPATRLTLPMVAGAKGGKYTKECPINIYPASGDVAKAKAYLKKAMTTLKITDPKKITLELKISDAEVNVKMATILQDQMTKTLGITVTIKQVTYKQMLSDGVSGKYETIYAGWGPDYDDPMTYVELFESTNSNNSMSWKNPKYDVMIESAKKETNAVKRQQLMYEAEKILVDEAPFIPLQYRQNAWLCKDNLNGVVRYFIGADTDFIYASFK